VKECEWRNGEMEMRYLPRAWSWSAGKSLWSIRHPKRTFGYGCKNCGFVEFHLEMKEKKE
jgi:hypothetical protein